MAFWNNARCLTDVNFMDDKIIFVVTNIPYFVFKLQQALKACLHIILYISTGQSQHGDNDR